MSERLPIFPRSRALPASLVLAAALAWPTGAARADVVTDWSQRSTDFIAESRLGAPPAVRVMALVQAATHGAVHAIVPQGPAPDYATDPAPGASLEAAVAAAHRAVFTRLLPAQQAAVDAAYQAALAAVPDGPARSAGVAVGEQAAARVLALRAGDALAAESRRPHAVAGTWVPTAPPAAVQWPQRQPWLMSSASQFRPPPPRWRWMTR